ncbi:MAG: hypothetical protein K0S01_1250 [Herbinix sp.]|jgi:hypothetical protein|nr:hypothetical protein [Herbinix sp.]
MNKGSHISLAHFLVDKMDLADFTSYKKAFIFGSILPDCLPSFLTTRHTMNETFELLKAEISRILENYDKRKGITSYYCRHLGIITHYIADYFTFPHNPGFNGSMREHCNYEKELGIDFAEYLQNGKSELFILRNIRLSSVDEICNFICGMHEEYLEIPHNIRNDCNYIVNLCRTIVEAILSLINIKLPLDQTEQIYAA